MRNPKRRKLIKKKKPSFDFFQNAIVSLLDVKGWYKHILQSGYRMYFDPFKCQQEFYEKTQSEKISTILGFKGKERQRLTSFLNSKKRKELDGLLVVHFPGISKSSVSKAQLVELLVSRFFGEEWSKTRRENEREAIEEADLSDVRVSLCGVEIPMEIIVEILAYFKYNLKLLELVGKVCQNLYLMILSSWPEIVIRKAGMIHEVSLLSLKSTRSIIFKETPVSKDLDHLFKYLNENRLRKIHFNVGSTNEIKRALQYLQKRQKKYLKSSSKKSRRKSKFSSNAARQVDIFKFSSPSQLKNERAALNLTTFKWGDLRLTNMLPNVKEVWYPPHLSLLNGLNTLKTLRLIGFKFHKRFSGCHYTYRMVKLKDLDELCLDNLETLEIDDMNLSSNRGEETEHSMFWKLVKKVEDQLRVLKIYRLDCQEKDLDKLKNLKNLEVLHVTFKSEFDHGWRGLRGMIPVCKGVKELELNGASSNVLQVLAKMDGLEHLKLGSDGTDDIISFYEGIFGKENGLMSSRLDDLKSVILEFRDKSFMFQMKLKERREGVRLGKLQFLMKKVPYSYDRFGRSHGSGDGRRIELMEKTWMGETLEWILTSRRILEVLVLCEERYWFSFGENFGKKKKEKEGKGEEKKIDWKKKFIDGFDLKMKSHDFERKRNEPSVYENSTIVCKRYERKDQADVQIHSVF